MDSIDYNFVKRLHENARITVKELANDVFISAPATSARIEKMRNDGIIKGYHAHFDMEKLGFNVTAIVLFSLNNAFKEEFLQFSLKHKNIIRVQGVLGEYTHIIEASFKHSTEVMPFLERLSAFGKVQPHIVTQEYKSYSQAQFTDLLSE